MIEVGFTGRFAPEQGSGFIKEFRILSTCLQVQKVQDKRGSRFVSEKGLKNKG